MLKLDDVSDWLFHRLHELMEEEGFVLVEDVTACECKDIEKQLILIEDNAENEYSKKSFLHVFENTRTYLQSHTGLSKRYSGMEVEGPFQYVHPTNNMSFAVWIFNLQLLT